MGLWDTRTEVGGTARTVATHPPHRPPAAAWPQTALGSLLLRLNLQQSKERQKAFLWHNVTRTACKFWGRALPRMALCSQQPTCKNTPFAKGPSAQQTLRRVPGDLQKVQQGESFSTSNAVLIPESSHHPSCQQKRLVFRPRTPGEALPFHLQRSLSTWDGLSLAACAKAEAPTEEGSPVTVQGLQQKRRGCLSPQWTPSRRSPPPEHAALAHHALGCYSLCSTHLGASQVATPSNPFSFEHVIYLRAGVCSGRRHPFYPGLLGNIFMALGRS